MLLVVTCSSDATCDYLTARLRSASIPFVRLNTDIDIPSIGFEYDETSRCSLILNGRTVRAHEVANIWLRRPSPIRANVGADEAERRHTDTEWTAAIEGFLAHIPTGRWMNHPAHNASASYKLEQLSRAHSLGLRAPPTIATNSPLSLRHFWETHDRDIVVKPLLSGYLERDDSSQDTLIYTSRVDTRSVSRLEELLPQAPALFQKRVDKTLDVRITIVDGRLEAVSMAGLDNKGRQRLDIRRDNMEGVTYRRILPPESVQHALRTLATSYGLRFAAIDMAIMPDGDWVFFEINPNGQWAWLDLVGVTDLASLFIESFRAGPEC